MEIQRAFNWLKPVSCLLFLFCGIERARTSFFTPADCLGRSLCKRETTDLRNCECDSQCNIFNDCCVDATKFNTTFPGYNVTEIQQALACETSLNDDAPLYVVDKCPDETNELAKQRCISSNIEDVLASVPVTGAETGLVFRNTYCALCHEAVQTEKLLFWKVAIDCEETSGSGAEPEDDNSYDELLNLTDTISSTDIKYCRRSFLVPKGPHFPRFCRSFIDHCSPDWTDEAVAKDCSSYNNYTYVGRLGEKRFTYRNWHCAMCNYVPENELTCKSDSQNRERGPPSMRLLLDLNRGHLTRLDKMGRFWDDMITTGQETLEKCPDNKVLDIFQGICRSVFCEAGSYINRDEKCQPYVGGSSEDLANVSLAYNLTCVLTRLNASEYEQYENGTVHVVARDLTLHTGEYVPSQNGSGIAICVHYFSQRTTTYTDTLKKYLVEKHLTAAGYTVSLAGLLTLFILYTLLPELRNLPGKCLMNLVAALFLAQLFFLLINIPRPNSTICKILSTAIHFLYLAAFFWMNVLGFDIWRTFQFQSLSHKSNGNGRKIIIYHVYAWGMPLLVVSAAVLVDEVLPVSDDIRPRYGDGLCWLNTEWGLLYFFAVPVALILAANIVFFSLSVFNICRTSCTTSLVSSSLSKKRHLLLNIKLSAIMGLTWTFGFLAAALPDSSALWYAFVITGSLQGVVICLGFACNQKTLRLLKSKRGKGKEETSSTTNTTPH